MKIQSGKYKGFKLHDFPTDFAIRPMTAQTKETVFNILSPELLPSRSFLDLFSGTGSLAFEACSRGLKNVHVVEKSHLALKILKKNQEHLKINNLVIHKQDVFQFIKKYKDQAFDIIIADPPFDLECGEKLLKLLVPSHLYGKGTRFIVETSQKEFLPESVEAFHLKLTKDFGDKKIWFYEVI